MKDVLLIIKKFVGTTILIALMLSLINLVLFAIVFFNANLGENEPANILSRVKIEYNAQHSLSKSTQQLITKKRLWLLQVNGEGKSIFEYNLPNDVPRQFSLTDIAKLSRAFLNDYPIYVWQNDNNLIILGYPKNSIAKYYYNFPVAWIQRLPLRVVLLFILNITIGITLAIYIGTKLIKSIKPIVAGVHNLAEERQVKLSNKGLFSSLANSINETSQKLKQKNQQLHKRDEARSNWITGISHDIRTPLSMILGYSSELSDNKELSSEHQKQAEIIFNQSKKINLLIKDLNLVSMLEYEMQPMNLKQIRLASLIRQIVANKLNEGLNTSKYNFELVIPNDNLMVKADENLLSRAITNLINNSIEHNPQGCEIKLRLYKKDMNACLIIEDSGIGVSEHKLKNITDLPYKNPTVKSNAGRGFGLPMVYRIIKAHKGELKLNSGGSKGFKVEISLKLTE